MKYFIICWFSMIDYSKTIEIQSKQKCVTNINFKK